MAIGVWQIAIILLVVIIFFGRGRISALMGDIGKGISQFRSGFKQINDD